MLVLLARCAGGIFLWRKIDYEEEIPHNKLPEMQKRLSLAQAEQNHSMSSLHDFNG